MDKYTYHTKVLSDPNSSFTPEEKRTYAKKLFGEDHSELTGEEKLVYEQYKRYVADLGKHRKKLSAFTDDLIDIIGKKRLIHMITTPVMIYGVPYTPFITNSLAMLLLYVWTQSGLVLMMVAPAVHFSLYLYYLKKLPEIRQKKINQIITEGYKGN